MLPTIIKVAAWGDKHVALLQENILPCLAAPGNLPALCGGSETELVLYVDRGVHFPWPARGIPGLKLTYALLNDLPNPEDLAANRVILARTEADSVQRATRRGADWFGLQADTLISNGFLPRVKELLRDHLAVVGSPIRTDLAKLRRMIGDRRVFSAAQLRGLSMECLHPVTAGYFVRDPPTTIPADPHQLLFRTPEGFAARTWQFCPFGISREGLEPPLYDDDVVDQTITEDSTIDCYLIQNLPQARVRFHDPRSDDFYLTSVDEASIPTFGEFAVTPAGIAASMRKFSRDYSDLIHYKVALSRRFAYETDVPLPDSLGEEETIAAVDRELMPAS